MEKKKFSAGIIIRTLLVIIGTLLVAYGWVTTISEIPPLVNPRIGIGIGMAIFLGAVIWHVWGLQLKLRQFEYSTPIIEIGDCGTFYMPVLIVEENDITWNSTSGAIELLHGVSKNEIKIRGEKMVQFAYIDLINNPPRRGKESVALGVWADIECCNLDSKKHLHWLGRWEGPAPNVVGVDVDKREFYKANIEPSSLPRRLKIIFRYEDDNYFYGFTNTSYSFAEWKDPILKFGEGKYKITITLKGENFSKDFKFRFDLECSNRKLELIKIEEPSFQE